jgi:hypothetical protein
VTALDRVTTLDDAPLAASLDRLTRAQDVTGNGAFAPVTPTLYLAACHLARPDLARRAERAAQWGVESQLASGAVWGGVVGTGRALLGWLSAFAETGSGVFAGAARRAGRFLFATLDHDGLWRRDGAYSPYTAWALAEAGRRLGVPEFRAAAATHLRAVTRDGPPPLRRSSLAEIAYDIRGVLEGGRLLGDERLIACAARAAGAVAAGLQQEGRRWRRAGSPWCPVGHAHMANVWLRLYEITGAHRWLEPVGPALRVLESGQRRPGTITAAKFLVDALIRDQRSARGAAAETTAAGVLA